MFECGRFRFSLRRPLIMGIVNITPDSFSDGGNYFEPQRAIAHALQLLDEGADILDLGAESTRPGATPVSTSEELARLLPVLEGLRDCGAALSVDTQKTAVIQAALAAGADMINDVNALQAAGALDLLAPSTAAVCFMHKQGEPQTMQQGPSYSDVVDEVAHFLRGRLLAAQAAGIAPERILIDPGFGFGKNLEHNIALLRRLPQFQHLNVPILVGLSRKSMLGKIAGLEVHERQHASLAAAVLAVMKGAKVVRVHEVKATRDALAIVNAIEGWHD